MNRPISAFQEHFESLASTAFKRLGQGEVLALSLFAEDSQFIRLNTAKVRQAGQVQDASLRARIFLKTEGGIRSLEGATSITGDPSEDEARVIAMLSDLQREVVNVPVDPYAVIPEN
ncbi:hypothetical protein EBZ37_09965, partial [bacterium]|nr:hypothetical protein [bacterium]